MASVLTDAALRKWSRNRAPRGEKTASVLRTGARGRTASRSVCKPATPVCVCWTHTSSCPVCLCGQSQLEPHPGVSLRTPNCPARWRRVTGGQTCHLVRRPAGARCPWRARRASCEQRRETNALIFIPLSFCVACDCSSITTAAFHSRFKCWCQ